MQCFERNDDNDDDDGDFCLCVCATCLSSPAGSDYHENSRGGRRSRSSRSFAPSSQPCSSAAAPARAPASGTIAKFRRSETARLYSWERNRREKGDSFALEGIRRKLPVFQERTNLLTLIYNNRVVVVSGATGCGKSTQVGRIGAESRINKRTYILNICVYKLIALSSLPLPLCALPGSSIHPRGGRLSRVRRTRQHRRLPASAHFSARAGGACVGRARRATGVNGGVFGAA